MFSIPKQITVCKAKAIRFYFLCVITISHLMVVAQNGIISEKSFDAGENKITEYWNMENGLAQNVVYQIYQTKNGYLWINSQLGLSRYDGNKMEVLFKSNDFHKCFNKIFEDSRGQVWLITNGNILYKFENGKIRKAELKEPLKIAAICENYEEEILLGSTDGTLYKLEGNSCNKITQLDGSIEELFCENDRLIISSRTALYSYENGQLTEFSELKNCRLSKLKQSADGEIFGVANGRLFRVEGTQVLFMNRVNDYVKNVSITDVLDEGNDKIWVATDQGLKYFCNGNVTNYTTQNGLTSNQISAILKDQQGNLWVGTENAGINKFKDKRIYTYSTKDGLVDDVCRPVVECNDGSVLIGHWNAITRWKDRKFTSHEIKVPNYLWSIYEDNTNRIWLGTLDSGVFIYEAGHLQKCNVPDSLSMKGVKALFQDADGTMWIASSTVVFSYKNNVVQKVYQNNGSSWVTAFMQDSKKNIWLCSTGGLGLISNGSIKYYNRADGLPNLGVRCIYEDAAGTYWIASYGGGISRFKNGTFFNYSEHGVFTDESASSIIEDNNGVFWISTNRGIYSTKKSDLNDFANNKLMFLNVFYHGISDGLKNNECNGGFQSSGLKLRSGKICFPTEGGLAVIDPNVPLRDNIVPDPIIESVTVDGELLAINDSLADLGKIKGDLSVAFTAPFFGEIKNLNFQYFLEGYDKNWSAKTNKRLLTFSNLPPGKYTLRIRVYGSFSEKKLQFTIPAPIWQTLPFFVTIALFLLAVLFLIIYLRIRTVKKKAAENLAINKRYAELELKALQGQMNPHFLFNCLNTIKYFVAADDKESTSKYLGKFSQMIRLFLEQSNANSVSLAEELKLLSLYIEMEQLRTDTGFEYILEKDKGVQEEETSIQLPTMLLQPFIENAIHHGLRPRLNGAVLKITLGINNNILQIVIDDNGIGRRRAAEKKHSLVIAHKSLGIKNVLERVDAINYIRMSKIELNIVDKPETQSEFSGTTVIINIPLITNAGSHEQN